MGAGYGDSESEDLKMGELTSNDDSIQNFVDSSPEIVRKGILELYLNVKIRSAEEIMKITDEKMALERRKLGKVDSLDLLDYIK